METRREKRERLANDVCRELRYQITTNDWDAKRLTDMLAKWLSIAKKDRYTRPN